MNARPVAEFESEPIRGLPEALPEGERILWQGAPDWRSLARRVFHTRKLAVYFAALLVLRAAFALADGQPLNAMLASLAGLATVGLASLGVLTLLAWLNACATVYTITNRRVVMRFGVAFVMALNLPFRAFESAALKLHGDGSGDIPLSVPGAESLGWIMLWPHARPWRFGKRVQPMLRAVPEAESVAALLSEQLAAAAQHEPEELETPVAVAAVPPLAAVS
ncbi:MAG: photosynthetic complex putative assembly protein PuhB [Myxococcota bacterium]|nr:photosynthetic complex putative assembly protein PuhB [Myxococcota bacterium]